MASLIEDASFLGALIGAASGLVGALIGGVATYYASLHQYRTEHATKQNSALAAALIEICRNQSWLVGELDRVLPLWLSRRHEKPSAAEHLREITNHIPRYNTRVFDAFFTELIPSRYGAELKTYYDRVAYLNDLSRAHENGLSPDDFRNYVRTLALGIEVGVDVATELNNHVARVHPKGWGREDDFGVLENGRPRALYMAALFRTKLSDLERFIEGAEVRSLPELIRKSDKELLTPWVTPARRF